MIGSLIALPVLFESCGEMFEKCDENKFTIEQFKLQAVSPSGKPKSYNFVLSMDWHMALGRRLTMGMYADCLPPTAIETITQFELTSDHDLVLSDRTLMKTSNLTSVIPYEYAESEVITNRDIFNYEEFKFSPTFTIAFAQTHTFTFSFTLSDGRKLNVSTPPIELLPE